MATTTTTKKPPVKQTVGAQYVDFDTVDTNGDWTSTFEDTITKFENVKQVKIKENGDTTIVHGSGKPYTTVTEADSTDIEVEQVAFDTETVAKMRGDVIATNGLILSGKPGMRPYFAYGKVVKLLGGGQRYEWYPKCVLTDNTDDTKDDEGKFSEQTDTLTIKALPFDDAGNIKTAIDNTMTTAKNVTEAKFFSKVILTSADLDAVTAA